MHCSLLHSSSDDFNYTICMFKQNLEKAEPRWLTSA